MDTVESLRNKSATAKDIQSVVRSMKAMAASNIVHYRMAAIALDDYFKTVALGLSAYLKSVKAEAPGNKKPSNTSNPLICAIVFGSDQGLVGQFNDAMAAFVASSFNTLPGKKEIWVVGERVQLLLMDMGLPAVKLFHVPNDVTAITPLVNDILIKSEAVQDKNNLEEIYIFHNKPKQDAGYVPVMQRLLPLDEEWRNKYTSRKWPTNNIPQVAGDVQQTLIALIREYLFVSLFRACAESLASENASRLDAMQRADKNIEELQDNLTRKSHRLRQSAIDEELFDVVSGFEALKNVADIRKT